LVLVGVGPSSSNSRTVTSNYNSRPFAENRPVESSHARGVQAGFEYGIRDKNANARKNFDHRRLKKLAAQISARVNEDQDWQLGWIDGYKKAFASSIPQNTNVNTPMRIQTAQQEASSTNGRQIRRPTGNDYIRGPRGGCYYLSASGRKIYVDRGLCN
jgi:hypothetical protein